MKKTTAIIALFTIIVACASCKEAPVTSDTVQQQQQETILAEGTSAVGMPAIHNFRERRMLKDIIEMRDQEILTYTYIYSEMTSKLVFFCNSIGYGLPYATQFTNPEKTTLYGSSGSTYDWIVTPQADPNGLFSPASAEGTWVLCKDPSGKDTKPVYVEPRIIVSPFKLTEEPAR